MPSGYLHMRCAQEASTRSGLQTPHPEVVTLGAQGPDPLFTLGMFPLRLSSKPGPLGSTLHQRRTGAFLCALLRRAKSAGPVEQAYAMGFLTHYALDSTVHPYVYAHSYDKDGHYSSSTHMLLEKQWDGLYNRRDGVRGTSVAMPGAEECRPHWQRIAALWSGAILEVFPGEDASPETILQALEDTARANRLSHSPRGIKYAAVWVLERIIGKPRLGTSQITPRFPTKADIENTTHQPWRNPAAPQTERTEGLAELFEAAITRAADLLTAAQTYFIDMLDEDALAITIGNAGYDTGMESQP